MIQYAGPLMFNSSFTKYWMPACAGMTTEIQDATTPFLQLLRFRRTIRLFCRRIFCRLPIPRKNTLHGDKKQRHH